MFRSSTQALNFVWFVAASLMVVLMPIEPAQSYTLNVMHQFTGYPNDGAEPEGGVVRDSAGNLYGTTFDGGTVYCFYSSYGGCGTAFKIAPDGTETILHSFGSGTDGESPLAGLTLDGSGNLYGTTGGGGNYSCGTVFKIAPDGTESVLYSFRGGSDGCDPWTAGVSTDAAGNLYGTTIAGGNNRCLKFNDGGCGTVYKIAPDGTETQLYAFPSMKRGWQPFWGVIVDKKGVVYGTAEQEKYDYGNGVVFKITPDGKMHIIHQFAGYPADGAGPSGALILDKSGNLLGTTGVGGSANFGSVFKIEPNGVESLVYSFQNGPDGEYPHTLIEDKIGNFYGLAGDNYGPVFRLSGNGDEKTLYTFGNGDWGPGGNIVRDSSGTIYGTLAVGGPDCGNFGCGAVYSLTK